MPDSTNILKAAFGTDDPAQAAAMFKAACALADRYRKERDGARAATAATKSKLTDAVLGETDARSVIAKALRDGVAYLGDGDTDGKVI